MILSEQEWEKAQSSVFTPMFGGRLHLKYPDGEEKVFDVWDYLKGHRRTIGIWKRIFDQDYFATVRSVQGMPDWEDGLLNIESEIMLTESEQVAPPVSNNIKAE